MLEVILMVIIMALVILIAILKSSLNIERNKVDTYRYYSLLLNNKVRRTKNDWGR